MEALTALLQLFLWAPCAGCLVKPSGESQSIGQYNRDILKYIVINCDFFHSKGQVLVMKELRRVLKLSADSELPTTPQEIAG